MGKIAKKIQFGFESLNEGEKPCVSIFNPCISPIEYALSSFKVFISFYLEKKLFFFVLHGNSVSCHETICLVHC